MSHAYIVKRATTTGDRYHVRYKQRGQRTPTHWGAYPTVELAARARDYVNGELAVGQYPTPAGAQAPPEPTVVVSLTPRKRTERHSTSLYRMFDSDGVLLYVGITSSPKRLGQHQRNSAWWLAVARVEVEHYPTRADALAAEADAIRTEGPTHNVLLNGWPA